MVKKLLAVATEELVLLCYLICNLSDFERKLTTITIHRLFLPRTMTIITDILLQDRSLKTELKNALEIA